MDRNKIISRIVVGGLTSVVIGCIFGIFISGLLGIAFYGLALLFLFAGILVLIDRV